MAYAFYDDTIGMVGPTILDTAGPGPGPNAAGLTFGRMNFYNEELRAYDATLGAATLVYLRYSGTIAAGTVCEITPSLSGTTLLQSATAWAGTVQTGRPLCVSLIAGTVGTYGWFVVQGNALVTTNGTGAVGSAAYWQAAGVVSSTQANGKQMLNAVFAVAASGTIGTTVLTATQGILLINRPCTQGQLI